MKSFFWRKSHSLSSVNLFKSPGSWGCSGGSKSLNGAHQIKFMAHWIAFSISKGMKMKKDHAWKLIMINDGNEQLVVRKF